MGQGPVFPVFVGEAPECVAGAEHLLLRWRGIEIAVPISIYIQSALICEEALAKRKLGRLGGKVVRFPRKRR